MVYNREQAARRAEASQTNKPGTCQLWTRTQFLGRSAGDQDGDGDADAVDGWKSEPLKYRRTDKNPPRGVPVAWKGGSNGFGHRAVSLGGGKIRSTDFDTATKKYKAGVVGVGTIDQISAAMGLQYLGWSETITGELIPLPTRGVRIEKEIADMQAVVRHMSTTLRTTTNELRKKQLTLAIARVNNAIKDLQKIPVS